MIEKIKDIQYIDLREPKLKELSAEPKISFGATSYENDNFV